MRRLRFATTNRSAASALCFSVCALVLLLAGCGGGGGGGNDRSQETGREITMSSGDNWYRPNELEVSRGERITLVISNDGVLTHNISIDEFDVKKDYRPGETVRVTFTPDRTGEFRFYCDEPGHAEAGMVGVLRVR